MTTIKVYEGTDLDRTVTKPLMDALTMMNKHAVLPVYSMQFIYNKNDMVPKVVLAAYDNKSLITEASSLTPHLEDVVHDKCPKTITPAIIVYPEEIDFTAVTVGSEDYHFSTSFLIIGKEFKDNLRNEKIRLVKLVVKSDVGRMNVETELIWEMVPFLKATDDPDIKIQTVAEECVSMLPNAAKPLHLPYKNYLKVSKSLASILNTIVNIATEPNMIVMDDTKVLDELFEDVKENQMVDLPNTNEIKVFKDFIKMKPIKLIAIYKREKYNDDTQITNMFLELSYKSNAFKVGVFYRYLNDIFNKLSGEYEDE